MAVSLGPSTPVQGSCSPAGLHGATEDVTGQAMILDPPSDDECSHPSGFENKEKGKAIDNGPPASPGESRLTSLPAELICNILSYLSPYDLVKVSETCRDMREHALDDHLWQALVQDHVPGLRVTSPYPCRTFHDLFREHDPRWFLPKYKIWFSDTDLPGRLIIVRYDQRRGCIEGYQLLANRKNRSFHTWEADPTVAIHSFDPLVKLHLDNPVLKLTPGLPSEPYQHWSVGDIRTIKLHGRSSDSRDRNRFQGEIPMQLGSIENMRNNFMYARALDPADVERRLSSEFPYGRVWPPPAVPAQHRVIGNGPAEAYLAPLGLESRPSCRAELCDRAFRIRKWIELRIYHHAAGSRFTQHDPTARTIVDDAGRGIILSLNQAFSLDEAAGVPAAQDNSSSSNNDNNNNNINDPGPAPDADDPYSHPNHPGFDPDMPFLPLGIHGGNVISTYATLDPALYTPTPEKPYQGIWVGDYSGHGCEFLWIHQPDDEPRRPAGDGFLPPDTPPDSPRERGAREGGGSDGASAKRRRDEAAHRGRLVAVKLTGDANIPRGEYTWVVDDLGEGGFVRVEEEPPFEGARVVRSRGHVANTGFLNDTYIDARLFLISPDRLAQHWVDFGHISYYQRVDIDQFLVPE
ncbi:Protein EXECUTER 2, chloroplastic [Madurella fahalii]|uniref:Protein EXECUTER 2, chloroplastic n=1 Tax=Madurella fahalii TaxID=1157608 RepID=A0ABQ0GJ14_9PEZI